MHFLGKGLGDAEQEHQHAGERDVGADRRDHVPAGERVRIVGIAARHAGEAKEVLREEGQVGADELSQKCSLAVASLYM